MLLTLLSPPYTVLPGVPVDYPIDFLAGPVNPSLTFLPRALAAVLLASVVTGVGWPRDDARHGLLAMRWHTQCSRVLRCWFVFGGNLMVGGLTAGGDGYSGGYFSQNQRLREDSVIGIFFAASFCVGYVIISLAPGYSGSVQDFCSARLWVSGMRHYQRRDHGCIPAGVVAVPPADCDGQPGP